MAAPTVLSYLTALFPGFSYAESSLTAAFSALRRINFLNSFFFPRSFYRIQRRAEITEHMKLPVIARSHELVVKLHPRHEGCS